MIGTIVVALSCPRLRVDVSELLEAGGQKAIACGDGLELVGLLNRHLATRCESLDVLVAEVSLAGYRPLEVMACLRWLGASFPTVLTGAEETTSRPSLRARQAGVRIVLGARATAAEIAGAAQRELASKRAWETAWKRSVARDAPREEKRAHNDGHRAAMPRG